MATRANIAIKNTNGTYDCIYTHYDGNMHLSILKEHYNSEEKARALVELGSISVLAEKIEGTSMHSFDNREDGVTIAYHRDRGEPLDIYRQAVSKKDCFDNEYLYVWEDNKWTQYNHVSAVPEEVLPNCDFEKYTILNVKIVEDNVAVVRNATTDSFFGGFQLSSTEKMSTLFGILRGQGYNVIGWSEGHSDNTFSLILK